MISGPDDFPSVPPMTKKDLAAAWPLSECVDGTSESAALVVASSGTSGTATFWPRGEKSFTDAEEHFDSLFRSQFGTDEHRTLVIVCFAMGTWTGGTYALLALLGLRLRGHRITVITPGVDLISAQTALTTLGPLFERIVIAGYPPYVRDLLDQATEPALRQDIRLLVGGEPTSEDWRDHVVELLGRREQPERVIAVYGASEIGFVGNETAFTIAVRRTARRDDALAAAVFGTDDSGAATGLQPTLVEYDPQSCYIETEDGYLLFTIGGTVPTVRYRVNDRGAVFSGYDLARILGSAGHTDLAGAVRADSWYLAMSGRTDVAASLYGANIYPDPVHAAIDHPAFATAITGKFVLSTTRHEQREQLRIQVELRPEMVADETLAQRLSAAAADALSAANSEYRVLRTQLGTVTDPAVVLEPYGSAAFPRGIKQRRVRQP
ncbi:phenylacetate--CoA ligase family protein [Nocardia sp. NBC_01377]|uniref:phenylacetate--CoA ligase family protein n=1 Tax=Nocardia sp. NBC_01377 TaxID=2903595 RepID=UPI0032553D85